jgi:protein-disulfide isomerase
MVCKMMKLLNSMKKSKLWLVIVLVASVWVIGDLGGSASSNEAAEPDLGDSEVTSPEADSSAQYVSVDTGKTESNPAETTFHETYNGMPAGFTQEGYPYLGDPNAPVTMIEYSDYLCPFSGRYYTQTMPALLEKYVRTGKVTYVYRDFPIASLHPTASMGSVAAACVGEQGAAAFWAMHDEIFNAQNEWGNLQDPTGFLTDLAGMIGTDMTAYDECMTSGRENPLVEEGIAGAKALGFNGTPSFQFVSNKDGETYQLVGAQPVEVFTEWLDALISGEKPPEQEEPEKRELPFWSNPDTGLAPDPDRPGFTLAGDPYKGDPKAPLTVIEFNDFQCSFCQRHALETQPVLDEQFVDTGEVRWVYKHFPLKMHPNSPVAAAAAECAADQGKFWEMYKLLFQEMDRWSEGDPDAELVALAEELKLDVKLFTQCFNGRNVLQRVLNDIYDGQDLIRSTPAFIVVYGGSGGVLRGFKAADTFVAVLEAHKKAALEARKKEVINNASAAEN